MADIEDAKRVRKGGKRLVAVLRTSEPGDHRLRNSPFMFDKSSVRITNKISQLAFASHPTLTSGGISQR